MLYSTARTWILETLLWYPTDCLWHTQGTIGLKKNPLQEMSEQQLGSNVK